MNAKRIVVLMTLLLLFSATSVLQAETVGYWRFESAANFLEDSGPNNLDLTAGGSPAPYYYALPATGNGSSFPDEIPDTGQANNGMVEFPSTGGVLSHADSPLFEFEDFTVEVFFHRYSDAAHMCFISQYSSTDNQRGWAFGVRADGNDNLFLYHCESGSSAQYLNPPGDLRASDDDDYYAAVSYSASGTATFYFQNLTDGTPLLSETVPHSYGPLFNSTVDLTIGNMANGSYPFAGVLDEIRLSNVALSESQLLVTPNLIPGDANGDGKVDGSDVTILAGNWQAGVGAPDPGTVTWDMGDFNGDGQVDGSDVTILAGNWQAGVTQASASVPEPSMLALLLVATVSLLISRRR